jgi:hypothetical protein
MSYSDNHIICIPVLSMLNSLIGEKLSTRDIFFLLSEGIVFSNYQVLYGASARHTMYYYSI